MAKILGVKRENVRHMMSQGQITIAVFGLGKMGLPLAAVFAEKGAHVIGVDINSNVIEKINRGICPISNEPELEDLVKKNIQSGKLKATLDYTLAIKQADVILVIVPTLLSETNVPDMSNVTSVMKNISTCMQKGTIVITECTMPPGSTEKLIHILEKSGFRLGKEFGVAHCPERTMSGNAIQDIQGQAIKIIGANDHETLEAVCGIYEVVNKKGVYGVSSIKTAEAVKVFEGVYRDVNIALANELAKVSAGLGVDALEAFKAANTSDYCRFQKPGCGVGGHCIPVYPWFIMNEQTRLIRMAREINDTMPNYTVELVSQSLHDHGKNLNGSNAMLFGLTYRGNVKEFTNSPAEKISELLKKAGCGIYAFDPLCTEIDAARMGVVLDNELKQLPIIDAIVITTDDTEFQKLDWNGIFDKLRTKVIIDGRQVLKNQTSSKIRHLAIGRIDASGTAKHEFIHNVGE